MTKTLVLTFIATDRPGLVERLSETVAAQGGNWLESRMAHLAGKFAGIAMIEIQDGKLSSLENALLALEAEGIHLTVEEDEADKPAATPQAATPEGPLFDLDLIGPDQPGILRDISHCLAERGVTVEEMETEIRDAPMSGGVMFYARARVRAPEDLTRAELQQALEALANSLMVDITLRD